MRDNWVPPDSMEYSKYLKSLSHRRGSSKKKSKSHKGRRKRLTSAERETILKKTDRRCHVCGGIIDGYWEADHVLAHSGGGGHSVDNYLSSHRMCNNYRWDYVPEEFQEILRLGVWLRTQIAKQSNLGKSVGEAFIKHEKRRISRRK